MDWSGSVSYDTKDELDIICKSHETSMNMKLWVTKIKERIKLLILKSHLVFKPNQHLNPFAPWNCPQPPRSMYCTCIRTPYLRLHYPTAADLYSIIRRQKIKINAPRPWQWDVWASQGRKTENFCKSSYQMHTLFALVRCIAGVQQSDWSTIERQKRAFCCVYHPSGEKNLASETRKVL